MEVSKVEISKVEPSKVEVSKMHIRHVMLWEFKQGKNASETSKKIRSVYGEKVITDRQVRNWFNKFHAGVTSLENEPKPGRPSDFNDEALKSLVESNPRQSTRALSNKLNTSQSTICRRLEKIGKVSKLGVWVPNILSEKNKADRISIATSLLSQYKNEPFLKHVITGDEKWVTYEIIQNKRQWSEGDQSPQPTPKAEPSGKKMLLCVWWDYCGIIYFEFLNSETLTAELYVQQLERVQQSLLEKRPALVNTKNVVLLHSNAPPHTARLTQEKILELGWSVLPNPPYSPDIAPSDYHLFRSLQSSLIGAAFTDDKQFQEFVENFFASKPPEFYVKGINDLPYKWLQVIASNGEYIID